MCYAVVWQHVVSRCGMVWYGNLPDKCNRFDFFKTSRMAPRLTQSPIQWVPNFPQKLRISGSVSPLPLHAFMTWTGTTGPFAFTHMYISHNCNYYLFSPSVLSPDCHQNTVF
jgi:hypothetical protein